MKPMHIVYTSSDRYWYPVTVSAKSALIQNVNRNPIVFDIISERISEHHKALMRQQLETAWSKVRFIELDEKLYANWPDYHNSKLVWSKCHLPTYLPDIDDWVCFSDGDILWLDDPTKLFELTYRVDDEKVVYGSYDWMDSDDPVPNLVPYGYHVRKRDYFCLGFAMLHVGKLREQGITALAEKFIKDHGIPEWVEQDIFNCLFSGKKSTIMPKGWAAQAVFAFKYLPVSDVSAVHFYGALPWPVSYKRRLMDIHAVWWYLALDLMNLSPDCDYLMMTRSKFFVMRLANKLLPYVPKKFRGRLNQSVLDVRLPLREMKLQVRKLFNSAKEAADEFRGEGGVA